MVAEILPDVLIRYANSLLKQKMLFGSDWPMIAPDKWLDAFEKAPSKDKVRPLILKKNAVWLLGVPTGDTTAAR